MAKQKVVVVGASRNPGRHSNRAVRLLTGHGHEVVPVHPAVDEVEGWPAVPALDQVTGPVDTVTLYVGPKVSTGLSDALTALRPRRVLFNPGAENPDLRAKLSAAGIATEEACTLVLLGTGQF